MWCLKLEVFMEVSRSYLHAWTPAPQSKPGVPGPYRPVGQSVGSQAFSLFCPSPKDDIDTETELHLVIGLAKNSQQAQPH